MKIKVRKYNRSNAAGWEVDIRVTLPTGESVRERRKIEVTAKSAAERWAQERVRALLSGAARQRDPEQGSVTLREFWPVFIEGYCHANREKHATVLTRQAMFENHFTPWHDVPLSAITDEEIQKLKGRLKDFSPKTVNNILTCLSVVLKTAVKWKRLARAPEVQLVKHAPRKMEFYEPDEYERLVSAAKWFGHPEDIVTLFGGDAGLRRGEMLGLEWGDIDFVRGQLWVQRAVCYGVTDVPKGGKSRRVPMTKRLAGALRDYRHLKGERVLVAEFHFTPTPSGLQRLMQRVEKRAGLPKTGRIHKLRHTFCSRLAMANVPMLTIKELAGHESLETTQRYMHLSSAAPAHAIYALEALAQGGNSAPSAEKAE